MTRKRTLLRRIEKLERWLDPVELPKMVVAFGLAKQDYENMAPGERIVVDRISDVDGMLLIEDRITSDPHDPGRGCEEVLTCFSRHIRWIDPDPEALQRT